MVNVKLPDGKYTIVQDATGRTKVLRYNAEWRDVTGDNVILACAYRIDELERELAAAQARIKRLEEDYMDLIMQVERKFDGETRHQTAKRYIMHTEQLANECGPAKQPESCPRCGSTAQPFHTCVKGAQ
jgi:hypothetical protein